MVKKEISIKELSNAITSEDILGKQVIDSEGGFTGVVDSVFINPETVEISGISIDNGLLKKGLLIGKNYIRNIAPHAVFLNIQPAFNLKGMFVFDIDGKNVGKIINVELYNNKNEIKALEVKSSRGNIEIIGKNIAHIGDNVLINDKLENILPEKAQ